MQTLTAIPSRPIGPVCPGCRNKLNNHTHTLTHMHAMQSHTLTHMHAITHMHLHTCMQSHTCTYTHACNHTHALTHMHAITHDTSNVLGKLYLSSLGSIGLSHIHAHAYTHMLSGRSQEFLYAWGCSSRKSISYSYNPVNILIQCLFYLDACMGVLEHLRAPFWEGPTRACMC